MRHEQFQSKYEIEVMITTIIGPQTEKGNATRYFGLDISKNPKIPKLSYHAGILITALHAGDHNDFKFKPLFRLVKSTQIPRFVQVRIRIEKSFQINTPVLKETVN